MPRATVDTSLRMDADPLYTAEAGSQVEAARPKSPGERQAFSAILAPALYIVAS